MTSTQSIPSIGSARRGCAILVAALLAGCSTANSGIGSSIYLHNAGDKAAIDKAAESLAAARTEHVAAFDTHRTYLVTAVADERRAIVAADLMRRDQELVSVLDTQLTVKELVTDRLNHIAKGAGDDLGFLRAASLRANQLPNWASYKEDSIRTRDRLIDLFKRAGGKSKTYCNDSGVGHLAGSAEGLEVPPAAVGYYSALATTC